MSVAIERAPEVVVSPVAKEPSRSAIYRLGGLAAALAAIATPVSVGIAAQLARRLSASRDEEFGSAMYTKMVCPGSAGSSKASYFRVRSPTTE